MSVIKMSEATYIAIHTVMLFAMNKGRLRSSKEIAAILGVSEGHLSKVLQILVKADLVESVRGPKGGFLLISNEKQLRILDIYKLFEGNINYKKCSFKADTCQKTCILEKIEKPLYEQFFKIYGETSFYDLINNKW
jgi:Rrf2 family protein